MPKATLKAKLILCNVPTVNSEAARRFYGSLLGVEFARALNDEVESYFTPISEDGIDLTITQRFDDQERFICYFAVEDLDSTLRDLNDLGAELVVHPTRVKITDRAKEFFRETAKREGYEVSDSLGMMAVVLDPDRNHVGLMQLEPYARPYFRAGEHQRELGRDQVWELQLAIESGADT
jgi:predicted enzyme related to lactoylglutathione lyase